MDSTPLPYGEQISAGLALYDAQGQLLEMTPGMMYLLGPKVLSFTFGQLISAFCGYNQQGIQERVCQGEEENLSLKPTGAQSSVDFVLSRLLFSGKPYLLLSALIPPADSPGVEDLVLLPSIQSSLLDGVSEMVLYQDGKMRIWWANQRFKSTTHYSWPEIMGTECYRIWHQRQETCPGCPVYKTIKTQLPQESILLQGHSYHQIRSEPYFRRGKMEGVFTYILDITEQVHTERVLQENRLKIKKLHEISFKMDGSQDEDHICQLTVEAAERILDLTVCSLDLVDGDYFVVKATSSGARPHGSRSLPITEGIAGKCLREGKTFVGNIHEVAEARPAEESYRSVISIPIGTMGVFQAISLEKNAFSSKDVELSDLLISHTREALKRIRTEKRLKYLSFHDSLTGLYNRSFFEEELQRLDTPRLLPLSMIVVDVNGLKLVNDNFGHRQGDYLLQQVAKILKKSCRQEDIIARCGGDEFNILLPTTSYTSAQMICQRMKEECRRDPSHDLPIPITMALGVNTKSSSRQDIFLILNQAEDRMYEDKFYQRKGFHKAVLKKFLKGLSRRNGETPEHVNQLQEMAEKMGNQLCLSQEMRLDLFSLIQLHDIGMIRLPKTILNKEGLLSQKEWQRIKKHPEFGYRIVRCLDEYLAVAENVLTHHEWWNGTGYPHGRKGEEIPLLSRIFSILDAYVSMTRKDLYRDPLTQREAVKELTKGKGTQFDPTLLKSFFQLLYKEGSV